MTIEDLLGQATEGFTRYQQANADRIQAALDTGAALIALRESLPHGEFLPAVQRIGIAKRTAQAWMRLSKSELKSETVAHLGGIRAAIEHLRQSAKTSDEVRAMELEEENADLQRKFGETLATATPDQLEAYVALVRKQGEVKESRSPINELITENDDLRRERTALERKRDRVNAEIEERRAG